MKMFIVILVVYQFSNHFSRADYEVITSFKPLMKIPSPNDDRKQQLTRLVKSEQFIDNQLPEDYGELDNGLIFQFRRSIKSDNTEIEARRRSALDKNFMRFGRGDKNPAENEKKLHSKIEEFVRKARDNKNFMRFGRAKEASSEEDKSDVFDKPVDKRDVANGENMEESYDQDKPQQIIYYRRDMPKNLMRFGRSNNFLRFGRANNKGNIMRFGRSDSFPRNSKMDRNFMRLGRSGFEKPHKNRFLEELLQEDETNNEKLKDIMNYDAVLDSIYDKV